MTKPLPLILESRGPWFLEFTIIASKAINGTPTIGLVDAEVSPSLKQYKGKWPLDLSRSQYKVSSDKIARCFAISFSPAHGCVFATLVEGNCQELLNGQTTAGTIAEGRKQHTYKANLDWTTLGDETRKRNIPIQAGIFVENGCLSFWRKADGEWHSTGDICCALPPRVLPCMFMYSFLGYARVSFSGFSTGPPSDCPQDTRPVIADAWEQWPLQNGINAHFWW